MLGERLEEVKTIATAILPALCFQKSGDEAVAVASEMLTLGWQTGDMKTQVTACQCALHAHLITGSQEAVELGRRAVQLSKGIGDKEQEAASLIALSNAHLHLQSPVDATRTAWEAISIVRELGSRKMLSACVHTLVQALVANKQVAEAVYWSEEEMAKCQKANDKRLESLISPAVVKAYVGSGNMDVAARKAEASLRLFQDLGNRIGECNMLKGLAELKHEAKRYEEAEACVNSALVLMPDFKDARGEDELLCYLDHICVARGAPEEAPHRAEALNVLHGLTRALEERNGVEFRELTKRFDTIGGVTEQEIRDIFGAAVERDQEGARDFIIKNIGPETLARAQNASAALQAPAHKPGCFFKLVERELLYTNFRKGMMGYGPRFRCMSVPASRVGQAEAYAVLRMTSESEAWEQELSLGGGPGILDCNLQTGAVSLYTDLYADTRGA